MTAMAARSLGYHVHALDPDPSCASRYVVERCVTAAFDDAAAAADLARGCAVVTVEIEKISLESMAAAARSTPVRPGPEVLRVIQDRARQKAWLRGHGFPLGPYREARSEAELAEALAALGPGCFVKTSFGGYDGGGQARASGADEAARTWSALGEGPLVVEQALEIDAELSVLVARSPSGEVAVYPPALNHHQDRILDWSVIPGPLAEPVKARAVEISAAIASAIGAEGLLVVELFLTRAGALLVNELAPRPHNSFHATEVACLTSQFEQAVRAVCDLPLGSTEVVRPAAICNLLGDLWLTGRMPAFDRALALPGVRLHLYGKRVPRPGRKMGHLSASGPTSEEAVRRVREARSLLSAADPG
jgi:5-(carboxyamino)imidazole ribonucleotide synthase